MTLRKNILILIAVFLAIPSLAYAATESFDGRGEYIMEIEETTKHGQEIAFQEALRSVSQQAAVAIKTHSSMADNQLTGDQMEMVTATVMQINEKTFDTDITPDGKLKAIALVRASLDVDRAEKMAQALLAAKNNTQEYERIQEEYATAKSQYTTLREQHGILMKKSARAKIREGIQQERAGRLSEAMTLYEEAIAADPDYARAYSRRAHIYRQQGKMDLANKDYAKAASIDSKEAGHHYGKAIMLEQQGKKAEAAKEYRLFIEYSDILEYDEEIPVVLEKILELEKENGNV